MRVTTHPTRSNFAVPGLALLGLMAAYPLSRYHFRLREPLYMVFVLGLLFPATVAVIPLERK